MAATRAVRVLLATFVLGTLTAPDGRAQVGEVLSAQHISSTDGGFLGVLDDGDAFGSSIAVLGDLDDDDVDDIVVGAVGDDDNGLHTGALWLLFMNNDGTVKSHRKIGATDLPAGMSLPSGAAFGAGLAAVGDLDGNGVPELAVGAPRDGVWEAGAVWILFLEADGSVSDGLKITTGSGGASPSLHAFDHFGTSVARLADLDGNGFHELAVGTPGDDDGASSPLFGDFGAVWILFMGADGVVIDRQKISVEHGGFLGDLESHDEFGTSVVQVGDLDGDGRPELAVGARFHGTPELGAVWVLSLDPDGTVVAEREITEGVGGFTGDLDGNDRFGSSLAALGDMNHDGVPDLAVGAPLDDDGRPQTGAAWLLLMDDDLTVKNHVKISADAQGALGGMLTAEFFGSSVAVIEKVGSTGLRVAFGAAGNDDGTMSFFADRGAVWVTNIEKALDSFGPACEIVDDVSQLFATGTASDGRATEDTNDNGQLDPGEDLNGNGFLDADSGIQGVSLAQTENVALSVDPFVVGDPVVTFTLSLVDVGLPGSATLRLRDVSGNVTTCPVSLQGSECFLVIGDAPGPGTFVGGDHVFDTLVGPALDSYPVLMETIPEFVLPTGAWLSPQGAAQRSSGALTAGPSDWMLDGEFVVQVVMWNPIAFPQAPEGQSSGLHVQLLPGGQVQTTPFGDGTGITLWAETDVNAQGQAVVRFPFSIPGL